MYTHDHVEQIRRVLALVDRGVPISRVRELLDDETKASIAARGPWRDYLERMAAPIARFDEPELDRIYDEALSLHPVERVTTRLILPLLAHFGERWKDLPGAIAEEHFFATYMRSKLGAGLQHRMRYASGPRLVAACAPGEQHEMGLLLFALEAQSAGMRVVVLGADTPLEDAAMASAEAAAKRSSFPLRSIRHRSFSSGPAEAHRRARCAGVRRRRDLGTPSPRRRVGRRHPSRHRP